MGVHKFALHNQRGKEGLYHPFQQEDILEVIKSCESNKAQGLNGSLQVSSKSVLQ